MIVNNNNNGKKVNLTKGLSFNRSNLTFLKELVIKSISSSSLGHEYPYSIKMKHLKTGHYSLNSNNRSFDGDDHLSFQSQYNSSSNSLNNVPTSQSHDFELRKREISSTGKWRCGEEDERIEENFQINPIENIDFFINEKRKLIMMKIIRHPLLISVHRIRRRFTFNSSVTILMNWFEGMIINFHRFSW